VSDENIKTEKVNSWPAFTAALARQPEPDYWIYRGQRKKEWGLKNTLERSLKDWEIELSSASSIELELIREFRRKYRGDYAADVNSDYLSCLALMRHHGASTRLLDFSYSPYVAAHAAIEQGSKTGVVWCLNFKWCSTATREIVGKIAKEWESELRNDSSFEPMYMSRREKFVYPENPFHLNERLIIQQGVFLCPGDISVSFLENLTALNGYDRPENVMKLCFDLNKDAVREFSEQLMRMNVNSAVLFPGLDGFARSVTERLYFYERKRRVSC
jgi:hypothetical protein